MIVIEIKGPQGSGKTNFINGVLIPAMEANSIKYRVAEEGDAECADANYLIIEKQD